MTTTAYVLQSLQNTNLCIGTTSGSAGSLVTLQVLSGIGDTLSQWLMDPNTGYIQLAADPNLVLDVQGFNGQQGQIIVSAINLGRTSQKWNWVGRAPNISNVMYPTMVVDNSGGDASPGNPILIWPFNGGQNQSWSALSVPSMHLLNAAEGNQGHLSGSPKQARVMSVAA